jgi:Cdc6-like AAA superfamily ATPase
MIAQFHKELETTPVEPLGGESTSSFLRRIVQGGFTDGAFLDGKVDSVVPNRPTIYRKPVIFLRQRSAGLFTMLDAILEELASADKELPEGLSRIVGIEGEEISVPASTDADAPTRAPPGSEPDILFSKPANPEQYEIAARLAKSRAVLVQGPPGTGKTHTIANLLGHLLAQGKLFSSPLTPRKRCVYFAVRWMRPCNHLA